MKPFWSILSEESKRYQYQRHSDTRHSPAGKLLGTVDHSVQHLWETEKTCANLTAAKAECAAGNSLSLQAI